VFVQLGEFDHFEAGQGQKLLLEWIICESASARIYVV
jgi:hypothetical protein